MVAGHPASSPSSSSFSRSSSSSSASFSPLQPVDGRPAADAGQEDEASAGLGEDTLGWMAVAVVGLALFALVLVLVTKLLRR